MFGQLMIRSLISMSLLVSFALPLAAQDKIPLDLFGKDDSFSAASALTKEATNDVQATAELVVVDAQTVDVKVHVTVPPHHYIYSHTTPFGTKTHIALTASGMQLAGNLRSDRRPKVVREFGETMEKFYDKVTWTQRLQVASGTLQPGTRITGELTGQYCSDKTCLFIDPPVLFEASLPNDFKPPTSANSSPADQTTAQPASPPASGTVSQSIVPNMRLPQGVDHPPIRYTVSLNPPTAQPGDYVTLTVTATIDAPYHTYSVTMNPEVQGAAPTSIDVDVKGGAAVWKTFKSSVPPEVKPGLSPGEQLELHHGTVSWTQEYTVADEHMVVNGTIHSLVCDDQRCLPPAKVDFTLQLGGQSGQVPAVAGADESQDETAFGDEARNTALIPFIVSAVGFGFLALLTPCVFPMIPVTVAFFLKKGEEHPGSVLKLAVVYCLAIIGCFTILGLLIAVLAGPAALNQFANNPWLNLGFAAVFTVFALMLMGLFEIQIPSALLTWTSKKQDSGGVLQAFFMALTFTLVSFTCTFAFVGSLLVVAAKGDFFMPIIGMIAFSSAFASPFFLLALFPAFLKRMPKSGGWMNSVKVTLGLVELALVTKFLSVADVAFSPDGNPVYLDYHMVMGSWIAIAVVTGLYLLNVFHTPHDMPNQAVGPIRCLFSIGFLGFAAYIATGVFAAKPPEGALWVMVDSFGAPKLDVGEFEIRHNGLLYSLDVDTAIAEATEANQPLFLDFTGVNCLNCRQMEKGVLSSDSVHHLLKDLVRAQLYCDIYPGKTTDPEVRERILDRNKTLQQDWFGDVSLPAYVIATPDGSEILARFVGRDLTDGVDFRKFLATGLQKWEERQSSGQMTASADAAGGTISASYQTHQ
ncbi:MAG: protein-disulfide reductase DsbD family protein [Planctomycetaceae bacterium]